MKFGLHVSIAGGIDKAPLRAYKLGCECFQIFSRSPRGGDLKVFICYFVYWNQQVELKI